MKASQEPKYMIVDENGVELPNARLANRETMKPIPDGEPVMIFRAKDRHSVTIINSYAAMCRNEEHYQAVNARVQQFRDFQSNNPTKEPD